MSSLNKVTLIGRVGGTPDIRNMQSGDKVASFSLATSESWKDKNTGEKKEKTEWHKIVVFNSHVLGVVERFVEKGSLIHIEGQLQTRKYEKDGRDYYTTEIVLPRFGGEIILLGSKAKQDDEGDLPMKAEPAKQTSYAAVKSGAATALADDDIPF